MLKGQPSKKDIFLLKGQSSKIVLCYRINRVAPLTEIYPFLRVVSLTNQHIFERGPTSLPTNVILSDLSLTKIIL